jgi:hypothetical protein
VLLSTLGISSLRPLSMPFTAVVEVTHRKSMWSGTKPDRGTHVVNRQSWDKVAEYPLIHLLDFRRSGWQVQRASNEQRKDTEQYCYWTSPTNLLLERHHGFKGSAAIRIILIAYRLRFLRGVLIRAEQTENPLLGKKACKDVISKAEDEAGRCREQRRLLRTVTSLPRRAGLRQRMRG